jgi:hypothetical protein
MVHDLKEILDIIGDVVAVKLGKMFAECGF